MVESTDKSYRLVFSFPKMVEALLRSFVGGAWLARLDFSTLEKMSERDLSPELVRREKDILWRLRYRDPNADPEAETWFYILVHLEFQSTIDFFMALRVTTYKMLLWEDLVRQGSLTTSGKLPPMLSVVLYNGKRPWTAPLSLEELIEPVPGMDASQLPSGFSVLSYELIEERSYPTAELELLKNPVATLFQLEQSEKASRTSAGAPPSCGESLSGPRIAGCGRPWRRS
jgi:hypothetical protein